MQQEERVSRLVALIEERIAKQVPPERPQLKVVPPPRPAQAATRQLDDLTRESHFKMIRHIRRRWGHVMQQLIDQACFGLAGVEQLGDEALVALHRDLERAQECMMDGVTFEDAGLLRSRYG